jgi:hypothetical protein
LLKLNALSPRPVTRVWPSWSSEIEQLCCSSASAGLRSAAQPQKQNAAKLFEKLRRVLSIYRAR